jgi:FkbM family methyltransferase
MIVGLLVVFSSLSLSSSADTGAFLNKTIKAAQVACPAIVRMGHLQASGWDVCITNLSTDAIVYSFGIDKDLSFEEDLIEKLSLRNVHAFDPTPYAKDWITVAAKYHRLPDGLFYHDVALAKVDGRLTMFRYEGSREHTSHVVANAKVEETTTFRAARLKSIMRELRHAHIDLLKIDIEGGEWAVLADILHPPILFSQLLVEFHYFQAAHDINTIVRTLNELGFKIFRLGDLVNVDGHFFQELCFIYTEHEANPIRPEKTPAPPTVSPEAIRQQQLIANRWSFSQREQLRDKFQRDQEVAPLSATNRFSFADSVFDRKAAKEAERDARIEAKYGPEAILLEQQRKQREQDLQLQAQLQRKEHRP